MRTVAGRDESKIFALRLRLANRKFARHFSAVQQQGRLPLKGRNETILGSVDMRKVNMFLILLIWTVHYTKAKSSTSQSLQAPAPPLS